MSASSFDFTQDERFSVNRTEVELNQNGKLKETVYDRKGCAGDTVNLCVSGISFNTNSATVEFILIDQPAFSIKRSIPQDVVYLS
jgi:hypothetical protein